MGSKGVIIGKFMPPHRGHEYLVNFASSFVDELWIFVCTLPGEVIPGELRFNWMKELFPQAKLVHIQEVNPSANRHQANAHKIWARAVRDSIGSTPDFIFASEEYGWAFAQELGARFIPVDPSRDQFPISGTEVRTHPFRYWHFIPEKIRPWFTKHIQIRLPDFSSQHREEILRTTAMLLQTLYVPQYDRFYQVFKGAQDHPLDAVLGAKAQTSMVHALAAQARFFLLRLESSQIHNLPAYDLDILMTVSKKDNESIAEVTPNSIHLISKTETIPYALRDAILDHYRDLL